MNSIVVNVDWYACSVVFSQIPDERRRFRLPLGWQQVLLEGTNVWRLRWFLLDVEGNKICTVLAAPRSPIIDARRGLIEIANQWLYREDVLDVLDMCLDSAQCVVDGLNRVDLCGDFEMTDARWATVKALEVGEAYLKGLRKGVVWWSSSAGTRVPHQLSWGGIDSTYRWKLYNKYKELHEGGNACSKPYIEEAWIRAGLVPQKVWRLEVSVCSTNGIERMNGEGRFHYTDWFNQCSDIYEGLYKQKFVVRINAGHKDKRNDPVVKFLDIEGQVRYVKGAAAKREIESDCQRRVVCKMWKEAKDIEVRANDFLRAGIRDFLLYMLQEQRNVQAICRRFGLTETEVVEFMNEL